MTDPRAAARPTVMLVEDHALVRAAVREAIEPELPLVAEAATAEEALDVAPRIRPDLLLVDIDLPGMDGIRLVRELAPRLPETRIVMLTVSSSDRDIDEALRSGARGYLTKDLSPDALLRAVKSAHEGELAMPRRLAARVIERFAEAPRRPEGGRDGLDKLSDRELEVLRLLSDGLTDRAIAEALMLSPRTIESHVSNILHKLGARNRAAAAACYSERA